MFVLGNLKILRLRFLQKLRNTSFKHNGYRVQKVNLNSDVWMKVRRPRTEHVLVWRVGQAGILGSLSRHVWSLQF